MDFLALRPLSPETGYHFGGGGASKVCAQKDLNKGKIGQSWQVGQRRWRSARIEPPTYVSRVGCITIQPLPVLTAAALPAACSRVCH